MVDHGHHLAPVALAGLTQLPQLSTPTLPANVNFCDFVFFTSGLLFDPNSLKRPLSASDGRSPVLHPILACHPRLASCRLDAQGQGQKTQKELLKEESEKMKVFAQQLRSKPQFIAVFKVRRGK